MGLGLRALSALQVFFRKIDPVLSNRPLVKKLSAMEPITSVRIQKLKDHLSLSTLRHEEEILKEISLKNAHIYCVVNNVSAQQYGPLLEKFIRVKNNFTKNVARECNGDCSKDNKNAEVKASLGGANHNKFNWVQLRVSHDIQYYILTAYHLISENVEGGGELYVFSVPKENMIQLIERYGGYAHGTKKEHGPITIADLSDEKNKKEYALRPSYGDACWRAAMEFRVGEDAL
jgi:hypothetical protein